MNNSKPLVSFIIATYNRAKYTCEAVQSILKQGYGDIEVIVIDDYSSDSTCQVLKETFGNKIACYRNSQNMGPAFSRNVGLGLAKGKYIGLLDSDDILYDENHTSIAVDIMEGDEEVVIFCCDFYVIDEKNNILNKYPALLNSIDFIGFSLSSGKWGLKDYFLRGLSNAGALVRRTALKTAGDMDVRYRIAWDVEFFLRILGKSAGSLYYYHKPLACYRRHLDCLTNSFVKSYVEKVRIHKQIAQEFPSLKEELGWKVNKRIAVQLISLSDAYKLEKRHLRTVYTAVAALIKFPPIIMFYIFSFSEIFWKGFRNKKLKILKI